LFLSLLFHISLVLIWALWLHRKNDESKAPNLTWIEVAPADKKNLAEDSQSKKRRLVQTSKAEKVDRPKDDSYLGFQNQVTDRETVSRNKNTLMGTDANQNKKLSKNDLKNNQTQNKTLSKLGVPLALPPAEQKVDQHDWATPGTRPEDYVEGMTESDRTALNTREYVFYGYFQRIRERLDRAWVPILRARLIQYYRSGRQLAGATIYTTKVVVIMNERGEIVRVSIVGESGTRDLDDAAVNAFNKAGPFPNPPKGMVDKNREVKIPWDFVLKT
jgi:protein TonB